MTPPRRPPQIPAVENDREMTFRQSPGNRAFPFVVALGCLVFWAICVWDVRAGAPSSGSQEGLILHSAGAVLLVPLAVVFLSFTGLNEICFDRTARTYRMRRYRPWPGRRGKAALAGIPFWYQDTEGPMDDLRGLDIQKIRAKYTFLYSVIFVWKDARRAPFFVGTWDSRADAEALMARVAGALGVETLS